MPETAALVADLGGTHARFGWVAQAGARPSHVMRLQADAYASPLAAAQAYLAMLGERLGPAHAAPGEAVFAVAAPATGDVIRFTNRDWELPIEQTRQALGLSRLHPVNDFEALAQALPLLGAEQLHPHARPAWREQSGIPPARACLAVVGPGTGLGVAALTRATDRWIAVPGEGGNSTLAASNDIEAQVLEVLRRKQGHISAETLLSGTGLPLLHRTRLLVAGQPDDLPSADAAGLISAALEGEPQSRASLHLFCAWLGSFCGDIALVYGARQGLYIGGGIVPRLGDLFFASSFRERFEAKGRFASYLKDIPTALILDSEAALLGCAALLQGRAG